MERMIVLSTTFRDFDGTENDLLQLGFLKALSEQTYENYLLVVSLFGEKNVEKVVREHLGERAVFAESHIDGYFFSPTLTFLNGIDVAKQYDGSVTGWCTSDIRLDPDYFKTVNQVYTDDVVITSHPNVIANSLEDFENGNTYLEDIFEGIDLLFFSTALLETPYVNEMLRRYHFKGYGCWEFFLTALAKKTSTNRLNLVGCQNVNKILNVEKRSAAKDVNFAAIWKEANRNEKILNEFFVHEMEGDRSLVKLSECHKVFSLYQPSYKYDFFFKVQSVFRKSTVDWLHASRGRAFYPRFVRACSRLFLFAPELKRGDIE